MRNYTWRSTPPKAPAFGIPDRRAVYLKDPELRTRLAALTEPMSREDIQDFSESPEPLSPRNLILQGNSERNDRKT